MALEYAENGFVDGQESRFAVMFRDVTEAKQQERRLAAFARTASSLAYAGSLQQVLDRVAADVLPPTGAAACAIVLIDPHTLSFRMAGTAGLWDDYLENIEACRKLGAPLATLEAFESRRVAVRHDLQGLVEDPRYAPMHDSMAEAAWTSAAGVPLVARDEEVGVLSVFYPADHDPTEADTDFLTAMADQVAVAVDNARLLGELEGKAALEERHRLARELHDSVSQALFSMNLTARATQMAVQQAGADPDGPVARGVEQLLELTQGALAEMRALIFQLRPEALHEEGLTAAVRKHAAAVAAREGLEVRVYAEEDRLPLAEVAEEELLRVVQEAVHNCVKHAHPHHVDIRLAGVAGDPGSLVVEVEDDGVGFEPSAPHPGHLGLDTMRERTERLGGRLVVESSDGRVSGSGGAAGRPDPGPPARHGEWRRRCRRRGAAMSGRPGERVIRVFLVDDHTVVRRGMRSFFDMLPDIEVIGEAADGQAALDELAVRDKAGDLPDVVLMDLLMPRLDGVAATAAIRQRHSGVQVVALTSFSEAERVHAALVAGAAGYLLKDAEADELAAAIRAAHDGEVHLDPVVARKLTQLLVAPEHTATALTVREREVLVLVAQGKSNREIADELVISERTARTHVSNVLGKLGLASRTQAALWAIREGLASAP